MSFGINLKDKRWVVIALLIALTVLGGLKEEKRYFLWVTIAVILCGGLDFLIYKFFYNRKFFPKSGIISGFILGGILDYSLNFFWLILFSLITIVSKYMIRIEKRHILNPANFALFIATSFKLPLTWIIQSNIFLIGIVGVYLAYSFKKFPHILGFLIIYFLLFYLGKINPFNFISWFFVFIMLIEPKTSGIGAKEGFILGGLCAFLVFIFFHYLQRQDIFVNSLFFTNILRTILESKFKLR